MTSIIQHEEHCGTFTMFLNPCTQHTATDWTDDSLMSKVNGPNERKLTSPWSLRSRGSEFLDLKTAHFKPLRTFQFRTFGPSTQDRPVQTRPTITRYKFSSYHCTGWGTHRFRYCWYYRWRSCWDHIWNLSRMRVKSWSSEILF